MEKAEEKTNRDYMGLRWPRLIRGTLIRRYKRFLADVRLRNGHIVTAHSPNTGSMLTCSEPGRTVYLSRHNNPNRKLKYTWEIIEMPRSLVGINTGIPNKLVKESIIAGQIPGLAGYDTIRSEVKYGDNSRIDLLLESSKERCFIEIKNCTYVENGIVYFPDAVTTRGLKHLVELQKQIRLGDRAVMFYLIQRMDAEEFRPADDIDPEYGAELRKSYSKGVEIMVYNVFLDLERIQLNRKIPYRL